MKGALLKALHRARWSPIDEEENNSQTSKSAQNKRRT